MKRTTYILIGILVLGLLVLLAFVFYVSVAGNKPKEDKELFPESVSMDATGVHTVKFRLDKENVYIPLLGRLWVKPGQGETKTFSYPKGASKYFTVEREKDTLFVSFRYDEKLFSDKKGEYELPTRGLKFNLEADSTLNLIYNNVGGLGVALSNLTLDSLSVRTMFQSFLVDSCRFRALNTEVFSGSFDVYRSTIRDLHINLNGIENWRVEKCDIDTEYLSGDYKHQCELPRGECRQMFWIPRNKDAELRVTLKTEARVLLQE